MSKRRRPTDERRRILAVYEEEAAELVEGGRVNDFEPAVKAAAERLGPYPPDTWWGSVRVLVEEFCRQFTPRVRTHLLTQGKMVSTAEGEGEGASTPLQMAMFEWTDYRVRVVDRSDVLAAHRTFVDAVDALARDRGAQPDDRDHTLGEYITTEEYEGLYQEHVGS